MFFFVPDAMHKRFIKRFFPVISIAVAQNWGFAKPTAWKEILFCLAKL